jgi:hypothetical protein
MGLAIVGCILLGKSGGAVDWLAWGMVIVGMLLALGLVGQLRRPRIAFRDGQVLFNLRSASPVAVPVEVVEAFFLGQGPANLSNVGGKPAETVNLVARLSQKAPEWAKVPVKPALGNWCEGYVTIRGTWCEPLDGEVIRRLNRRLREIREAGAKPTPVASANSARSGP